MSHSDPANDSVEWRKARRSMGNGNCVEIASSGAEIMIRDSKNPAGPVLKYADSAWMTFVASARSGTIGTGRF
jgi:hypothetical protein